MIGISCTGFSSSPITDWVGPVSETFRLWEIFSEADHCVHNDTESIMSVLDQYGLFCQVHAPICDWNVASMTDRLMRASIDETKETIDAAEMLGAKVVTVHPGLSSMAVPGMESRAVERANIAMRELESYVDGREIVLAIENMPNPPFFLGRTASQLAEIVDGTDLGICFDIGHANTMGEIDAMIDSFKDRIVNIHIHDNNGDRDAHMTLGQGSIDFTHVIRRMSGYKGNWIIESKSLESAIQSKAILEFHLA